MKISFFLFLFVIALPFYSSSQVNNELIKLNDLRFDSEEQRRVFYGFNEKKEESDAFDLLYQAYDESQSPGRTLALKRINDCVTYLTTAINGKSEAKAAKTVYNYVHKEFLKVYREKNSFVDLFETGEFNCVSASALYALVFSKLAIPFQIKETPTHVYLVAYPNTGKILIETTAPQKGYYQFTYAFVNKFVANLYESKLISKAEYETVPANDLFNRHFFSSENISLIHLAGLQYSNFAIYDLEKEELKKANEEAKKAYFIYPDQKHKYILESTLSGLISKNGYDDMENVSNLILLSRFSTMKNTDVNREAISNEFIKITQTQLIKNSDYEKFDQSYLKFSSELTDTILKKDIGFMYHFELARLGYLGSKSQEYVINHLDSAYQLNPLNANMRSLTAAVYERALHKYNDSKSIMELSDLFAGKFGFMREADYFLDIRSRCLLDLAYQTFFLNDILKGENYLHEFETFVKNNKSVQPTAELVERAYGQAAGVYYKKGNYAKAKQLVKTGLIYAPASFGLQQRLNQLK